MPSLYRKWRSRSFEDLYGQDHVVRTLRNAVRQQRVAHAYLFTGPRGTGKTSTARILAKAVNCLEPEDGNPCNRCEACRAASEGRAVDVIEIDAASNTGVDSIRDLRERVAYAAGEGRFKVYIVDEVHRLSASAFDAFLKTLEEPPEHVIFVFASTEPHKVPATIASRCQRFDFRRIPPAETLERLRFVAAEEGLDVSDEALRVIALHAAGSLRDALGILDQVSAFATGELTDAEVRQVLGIARPEIITALATCLRSGDIGEGLRQFGDFVRAGGDPHQALRQLADYWRVVLLQVTGARPAEAEIDPGLAASLASTAATLSVEQAANIVAALTDEQFAARYDVDAALPFELAYVRAALALQPAGRAKEAPPAAISSVPVSPPATVAAKPTVPAVPEIRPQSTEVREAQPRPAEVQETRQPAAAESAAPAEVGDVAEAWPRVVAGMRQRSRSTEALLKDAFVLDSRDGELTIGFLWDFHANQFADVQKRRMLEQVIAEVTGTRYRVQAVRTTKEAIESARGAGAVVDDDGFVDEAAERLRLYHVKQLEGGAS